MKVLTAALVTARYDSAVVRSSHYLHVDVFSGILPVLQCLEALLLISSHC